MDVLILEDTLSKEEGRHKKACIMQIVLRTHGNFWKLKIHKTLIKTLMMRLRESLDTQNLTTNLIFVDMVDY